MKSLVSLVYLALITVCVLAFYFCFVQRDYTPVRILFFPGLIAYLATLTFAIWIHPAACLLNVFFKGLTKNNLLHLFWSLAIACWMFYLVFCLGNILQA